MRVCVRVCVCVCVCVCVQHATCTDPLAPACADVELPSVRNDRHVERHVRVHLDDLVLAP